MRKIVAMLLALLLVCGCACAEVVYTTDMIKEEGPGKLSDELVTLTFFKGANTQKYTDFVNIVETKWLEEKTNVHIEWIEPASGEENTALNLLISGGDYPDVIFGQTLTTPQIISYAQQGVLLKLNDYLEKCAPDYLKVINDFEDIKLAVTAPNGDIYSFVRTDGGLHARTGNKMYVYTAWLEAYMQASGAGEPATTEELEAMLTYFRDNDMNGNGDATDEIPLTGSAGDTMLNYLLAPYQVWPSTNLDVKDGVVFAPYMTDEWKEGLKWIRGLFDKGLISTDAFVQDGSQLKTLVSQPDSMVAGSLVTFAPIFFDASAWPEGTNVYKEWTCIGQVAKPGESPVTEYKPFSISQNGFVTTACEYPEVAVKWLNYWYTQEGMTINCYGFEGLSYEWIEAESLNGKDTAISDWHNTLATSDYPDWRGSGIRLQTPELRYSVVNDDTSLEYWLMNDSIPYVDCMKAEFIPSILWMDEAQANEIAMLESVLVSYIKEMTAAFCTGGADIDSGWDSYVAELEAMGVARLIELYQEII